MSTFKSVTTKLAEMKQKYESEVAQVLETHRQSVLPLTDEFFESRLAYLTLKDIRSHDFSKYALECVFQGNLEIIDVSRKKVRYMDASGAFVSDPDLQELTIRFFKVLSIGVEKFLTEYYKYELEYKDVDRHEAKHKKDWEQKTVSILNRAAKGDERLFTKRFILAVCKGCK
jgi:hypothetical protein